MKPYLAKIRPLLAARYREIAAWSLVFALFYGVGLALPVGFDWRVFFSQGDIPAIWTPWTGIVVRFLNFPLIVAITLTALALRAYRYSKSPLPMALAILSLPTFWVLMLGNLDGLVLVGLMVLPWGIPLVAMKPQLAAFALLAKKSSIVAGVVWGLLSLVLWGPWPLRFLTVLTDEWAAEWTQDIAIFPWGLLIGLPLLWLSRGDEDLLMLAGSFATPHLFLYHYMLIMPALGRMSKFWMLLTWALCWSPLLANWFGPPAWRLGYLFALSAWAGIYLGKRRAEQAAPGLETARLQAEAG